MFRYLLLFVAVQFLLASFAYTPSLAAAPSSPEERVMRLQKKYQQLRSLEFDFSQTTLNSGRVKMGSGNAIFLRPTVTGGSPPVPQGIMRWNYASPTAQIIVNDGKTLSLYTPQDKQMIVSPAQDMESDITYAIFTGTKKLQDEFKVESGDASFIVNEPPAGLDSTLLTPRQPHPQIKRVQLWFTSELTIHRLLMEDHFGAMTELTFTGIRFNALRQGDQQQVQALLKIDTAPGTEIIRQ
jgi:outer membrane lipoprotein carrier protein